MACGRMDGLVGRMQGAHQRPPGVRGPTADIEPLQRSGREPRGAGALPSPSALPVDDGPAQADLAIVEDDGLSRGNGPLRLRKADLDA